MTPVNKVGYALFALLLVLNSFMLVRLVPESFALSSVGLEFQLLSDLFRESLR